MVSNYSMDAYIEFNKAMKTFLRCSIEAYPEIKEFKLCLTMYKLFKTMNKKKPCQYFLSTTKGYHDAIMAKDEAFFSTQDIQYNDFLQDIVVRIKTEWDNFTPESKDAFWQHLQVMVILSNKCVEKKE